MLRAQDAQEQPFAGGPTKQCPKKAPRRLFSSGTTQPAKATLLHTDVRMLRAQDAQEQPFAGGRRSDV
jgi:hypothetical protein